MTESEQKRFHEFLIKEYGTTYNHWLNIVEPLKTAIYDSFLTFNLKGSFVKVGYSPKSYFFASGDSRREFSKWLKQSSNISYDCFVGLDLKLKQRIYRAWCESPEGRKSFAQRGALW